MALFNGEFDFSSIIEEIDSADETLEWTPNGLAGLRPFSMNGSGALF
jgi:hypothetical protein